MNQGLIIETLFEQFIDVRYVALYLDGALVSRQKEITLDSSSGESDKYEELLVNPTLLKLAGQRGEIDCGGLEYLIIRYGSFYQIVKALPRGHISICVNRNAEINNLPKDIFKRLKENFSGLFD